ncbi:MAG: pseudouridine synthase [Thermoanaerobaculia bacterium]
MTVRSTSRNGLRPGEVTLERALSKLGLASRREARAWIASGRVSVDGAIELDPLRAVVPERIRLEIDGVRKDAAEFRFLLLNKPRGYVTTRADPEGRPTVFDLVADARTHLVAVGRLDFATSGVLLLTNDTRLADLLTDPSNAVPRVYVASVRGRWDEEKSLLVKEGVAQGDELLRAADVVARKSSGKESHLVVTLASGKNREVRRLLAAVGHEVQRLKRVAFGGLELGSLPAGKWREVSLAELSAAFGDLVARAQ